MAPANVVTLMQRDNKIPPRRIDLGRASGEYRDSKTIRFRSGKFRACFERPTTDSKRHHPFARVFIYRVSLKSLLRTQRNETCIMFSYKLIGWMFLSNGFIRGDLKQGEKYTGGSFGTDSREIWLTRVSGSADVISNVIEDTERYVSNNMKGEMCFIREEYVKLAGRSIQVG